MLVVLFLVVLLLSLHSLFRLDHNDFMYSISAVSPGDLYADVHYVQAPLGFYFWKLIGLLAPEGYKYLVFRLVSLSLIVLSVALVLLFIVKDNPARIIFLLFVGASQSLVEAGAEIGTYSLSLVLVAAGMVALGVFRDTRGSFFWSGLLFSLAASAKLNHILLLVPLGLWAIFICLNNRERRYRSQLVAAVALGAIVGLAPIILEFVQAPEAFMLHNIYFHSELTNDMRGLSLFDSLRDLYRDLRQFGYQHLTAVFLSIYALTGLVRKYKYYGVFLLGNMATAMVMGVTPLVISPKYLAPASFFCALVTSFVFIHGSKWYRTMFAWCVLPVLTLSVAGNILSLTVRAIAQGGRPDLIRVLDIQKELQTYAGRFNRQNAQCSDTMFSFAGALVIDSGFSPARHMEAGVFWYRLSGFVPNRYIVEEKYQLDPFLLEPPAWIRREGIDFLLVGFYEEKRGRLSFLPTHESMTLASGSWAVSRVKSFVCSIIPRVYDRLVRLYRREKEWEGSWS